MIIKGYHTLEDQGNVDKVEANGPVKCTDHRAWLGDGYYFWDSDIYWAHFWGKKDYAEYMIFVAEIEINEKTYDLVGNIATKLEFLDMMEEIKGTDYLEPGEEITVPKMIAYLKKYVGFEYNSIRAADYPRDAIRVNFGDNRPEFMFLGERVQVCLLTKENLLLQSFRCIHPEEYLN